MYLTFMAMLLHYAKPSYEDIMLRVQSQQYIQPLKIAQLKIQEYFFLKNSLPEEVMAPNTNGDKFEIHWDGQSYILNTIDDSLTLTLTADLDDYQIKWSCEADQPHRTAEYICHALT